MGGTGFPLQRPWPHGLALAMLALLVVVGSIQAGVGIEPAWRTGSVSADGPALPLSFVPNRGQTDAGVRYQAQGPGSAFFFTDDKVVLSLTKGERGQVLELSFPGASEHPRLVAAERATGKINYLIGEERQVNLPTFGALTYRELWPGIDLTFRAQGGSLKYEFLVQPGADPSRIRLSYAGAGPLAVGDGGTLDVQTAAGTLTDKRPISYQRVNGRKQSVGTRYSLHGKHVYGFAVAPYDRGRPLIIDPELAYSTLVGGVGVDRAEGVAVDGDGSAYITGTTTSTDFPTTPGAFDSTRGGVGTVHEVPFVTKLAPDGRSLVYSTYLGGQQGGGNGEGITVDENGHVYIAGTTAASDFPTTEGAFDRTFGGGVNGDVFADAFVTKLNQDGSALVYSTYLGGTRDEGMYYGKTIAVDPAGNAYITGDTTSSDFPTTPGAFDTSFDGGEYDGVPFRTLFVSKLNAAGSALTYSTYLGGGQLNSRGPSIAVDGGGHAVVASDVSEDFGADPGAFPTTPGAFDPTFNGDIDAFVTKFEADGSALVYSTFLGGTQDDYGDGVALDGSGGAAVTGATRSADFPVTAGAYDTTIGAGNAVDVFVAKVSPSGGSLEYGTFLGGTGGDQGHAIAVDGTGAAHVAGSPGVGFPVTPDAVQPEPGSTTWYDAIYFRLTADGSGLDYSTYLGGSESDFGAAIAVGPTGDAYVAGETNSPNFPTTPGAFDTTYKNEFSDAFVVRFAYGAGPPTPCRVTGHGQIRAQNGDRARFRVIARVSGQPRGKVSYLDMGPAQRSRIESIALDAVTCSGSNATISGRARLGHKKKGTPVEFRVDVTDSGRRNPADTFRIVLRSGYDSGSQSLEHGDVRVLAR